VFFKILKIPFIVLRDVWKLFIVYMPGGFGVRLRYMYYRNKFKKCGKNLVIDVGVHIDGAELISVGDNVYIDKYCIIATGKKLTGKIRRKPNNSFKGEEGEIIIGNDIHIAQFCILMGYGGIKIENKCVLSSGCKIYSLTNTAYDIENKEKIISIMPYTEAPFLLSPVVFENNTWLGLNTVVMPSVNIGQNSFCAINSIVMNNFIENSYISGQPAKRVKDRFKTKEVE
jgi:acetyltransferase-like isoleucine patch superfamily enzyme